jgi:hypothetical protein
MFKAVALNLPFKSWNLVRLNTLYFSLHHSQFVVDPKSCSE